MYLVNAGSRLLFLFLRVLEKNGLSLSDPLPRNDGISTSVGEALMAPTVIYVNQVGFCFLHLYPIFVTCKMQTFQCNCLKYKKIGS
jgi:hypothetical protein